VRLSLQLFAKFIKKVSPALLLTIIGSDVRLRDQWLVPIDENLWHVNRSLFDHSGHADRANTAIPRAITAPMINMIASIHGDVIRLGMLGLVQH
jgi:hypothetical protein